MIGTAEAVAPTKEVKQQYPAELPQYKRFAYDLVVHTWSKEQWKYFDDLIQRESSWRHDVKNPNSSAYGLPQAMLSLHDVPDDFKTNPETQIKWAVNYIQKRYETPKKAISYWDVHNHY